MKTSWSPTSRAKPISWVTTIMVMPLVGELPHDVEDLADQLGVQRRGRLVEEHQLGPHGQRPGDRDALLLAAGQLRGVRVRLVRQPDPVQQLPGLLARLGLRDAPCTWTGASIDVLERRHVREQVEVLEHHADVAALLAATSRGRSS